jgi:hypothetical protein
MSFGEHATAAVQAAPPVVITGASIFGVPLNDAVMWGTAAYLVCQFVVILPKVIRTIKGRFK